MARGDIARLVAFVLRCAGAAAFSYLLAGAVGLPHPVWACMSAVIVSQEDIGATRQLIVGRLLGTLIGAATAVAIALAAARLGFGVTGQIAASVGLCTVFAYRRPGIRACMWTGPIVLLTEAPGEPIAMVGFYRASEVVLGVLLAGALHLAADRARLALRPRGETRRRT